LIALTLKKTRAARLRIVVMMATKLASSLSRLSSRLTNALWRNLAATKPSAISPRKAASPRMEM
jgi:hypothetical protein